jgi:hypothetical protein
LGDEFSRGAVFYSSMDRFTFGKPFGSSGHCGSEILHFWWNVYSPRRTYSLVLSFSKSNKISSTSKTAKNGAINIKKKFGSVFVIVENML